MRDWLEFHLVYEFDWDIVGFDEKYISLFVNINTDISNMGGCITPPKKKQKPIPKPSITSQPSQQ